MIPEEQIEEATGVIHGYLPMLHGPDRERCAAAIARVLAKKGLLAPGPVTEEVGCEMYHPIPGWYPNTIKAQDLDNALWQRENNPHCATGRIMRRHVSSSGWTPMEES